MRTLTVIHTNDLHDRLTDEQAEELARLKTAASPSVLLLDAGDAIGAGNITFRPEGEPILDRMAQAGYDAMAVGNREFHMTATGFVCKIGSARFPVLCANVKPRIGEAPLPCRPWIALDVPEFGPVVLFGLTVPMITNTMAVRHLSAYVFQDPIQAARQLVPELVEYGRAVICLSHLGTDRDRYLATELPAISLIVGGHNHTPLPQGLRVGRTLIVQASPLARGYGVVKMTFASETRVSSASLREFSTP